MDLIFKRLVKEPHLFLNLLPEDWQACIVPFWSQYKDSASIYAIQEDARIVGGGIVFSKCPPDIEYYKNEAQEWFDNGYLYLGFIWIAEDKRKQNLGSYWLRELKILHPKQRYWLLIEEDHLHRFYQKNGFALRKTIAHRSQTEWLYTFDPLPL